MKEQTKISVGGQAVIEGVMMRGPERIAIAVRKPDVNIAMKCRPFQSITKRLKFLGWPILRGAVVLIESIVLGVQALTFSGDIAMGEENARKKKESKMHKLSGSIWLGLTVAFAFAMGLLLFFYVPLLLTDLFHVKSGILFNLIDGIFRLLIFLAYILLLSKNI